MTQFKKEYEWALDCLSPEARANIVALFDERPAEMYTARLRKIGFAGLGTVLDLACGIGQWSLALAALNERVIGIDTSTERLLIAQMLVRSADARNVALHWGRMEDLPLPPESVDGCFCYVSFMYGDGDGILRDLHRVMRSGSPLYLNVTGVGFNVDGIRQELARGQLRPAARFARMLVNRVAGRNVYTTYTRSGLRALLDHHGFDVESLGNDGSVGTDGEAAPAFYPGRVLGLDGVFEVIARRR